ncbi:methanobactin export MATE transporter MbnM [Sphingomonas changnyeongensis]|uniref:methanobactin export MATE transporter MbnM n=1 Tax=Sphingomonas changnyeongensis TaxID=2698679 RepID=UPI00191C20BE|nr:methanobactin export MATE transporter MbnM [Sphingomonas changnyeongensis]
MRRASTLALMLSALILAFSMARAQQRLAGLLPIDALVASSHDFGLPGWAPRPLEPVGNRTTAAKIELGRHLFYDTRLSGDGSMSCASCHRQARAFTDGRPTSAGVTGQMTPRNAMSLANVAYFPVLTWGNPLMKHLEQQALVPLIGQEPVELGLAGRESELVDRLRAEPVYARLFPQAFPEAGGEISLATVVRALAAFQRSLISLRSPYDRYRYEGDADALSESAIRGEALFFSERLECHHCHNGINFADTVLHERNKAGEVAFHNTGLYNIDGKGGYPAPNIGIAEITGRPTDMGRFRAPSLRNVAVTAPYMHDGSIPTLDQVIDHYAAGGVASRRGRMPASAAPIRSKARSCPASR